MRSMSQFTRSLYTGFINYQLAGVCQVEGFNHSGEHHGSGLQNEKRRSMTEFSYRTIELHQHFLPVLMKRADLSPSMVLHYQRGRERASITCTTAPERQTARPKDKLRERNVERLSLSRQFFCCQRDP